MKRHQIHIVSDRGKTWASCQTCGRSSKQLTKKYAEGWMVRHQDQILSSQLDRSKRVKSQ